jgi:hypothetical protein
VLESADAGVTAALNATWERGGIRILDATVNELVLAFQDLPDFQFRRRSYLRVLLYCAITGWQWIVGGTRKESR